MPRFSWAVRVLVFGLIVVGLQADLRQEKLLNVRKLVTSSKENHEFLEALESRLLNMFGLKSRPKPKRNIKIPKYMLELYKQHASSSDWQSVSLNLRHTSSANTVRSHTHQETGQEDVYGLNRVKFKFNISSLNEYELLKAAELRIFRQQLDNIVNSSFKCKNCNKQRIQVYDILRPATRRSEALLRLIDTKVVDIRQTKWESFDILPAVLRWREDPTTNYGLYVQVNSLGGKETPIEHVRLKRTAAESAVLCEDYWLQRQPLVITYSDDGHHSTSMRFRRSARKHRRKGRKDNCRRHDLYVDFSDVGWNDWIVAPPGYDAYYCHGECPFPLADHLNSTNHAIVQTLVNSVNPTAVPRACCVPTELSPISMLYVDEYDKVVLKNYQDMVVEGCGCR